MLNNRWLVFAVALIVWAVIFYAMDKYLMEVQGLPVGSDMMPL